MCNFLNIPVIEDKYPHITFDKKVGLTQEQIDY